MSKNTYKFLTNDENPYFITSTVVNWLPLLADTQIAKIIIDSLAFLQREKRITLYAYVVMKTHFHLVASATDLAKEIANFRSYTARKSIDYLIETDQKKILEHLKHQKLALRKDREHQFWQEGVQPKRIFDRKMMIQKIMYIHENPVRKSYVEKAEDWLYSSAGAYEGISGLLDVYRDW